MRLGERRATLSLAALGCCLLAVCAFYAYVYTQTPQRLEFPSARLIGRTGFWSFIRSSGIRVPQLERNIIIALVFMAGLAFLLYAAAIYLTWNFGNTAACRATAFTVAIAGFAIATSALPNFNTDIYNYIANGRVFTVHHRNPYEVAPDAFPTDAIYRYTDHQWTGTPGDHKLGAWMLTDGLLARVAGGDVVTSLIVYRTFFAVLNVLNLIILLKIMQRLRPERQVAALVIYGWNPIVAIAGQSKVDTEMAFFLLTSVLLVTQRKLAIAAVMLTLSTLIKLIALPLLVLLALNQAVRRRWKALTSITAVAVLTTIAVYAPFLGAPGLVHREVRLLNGQGSATTGGLHTLLSIAFVALLIVLAVKIRDDRALFPGWAVAALYFAMFLTVIGYSWYLIVMVALMAVSADVRLIVAGVLVSCPMFLVNTWQSDLVRPFPLLGTRYLVVVSAIALVGAWVASLFSGRQLNPTATTAP